MDRVIMLTDKIVDWCTDYRVTYLHSDGPEYPAWTRVYVSTDLAVQSDSTLRWLIARAKHTSGEQQMITSMSLRVARRTEIIQLRIALDVVRQVCVNDDHVTTRDNVSSGRTSHYVNGVYIHASHVALQGSVMIDSRQVDIGISAIETPGI